MQHVAIYKGTFARLLVKRFLQIAGSMQHIAIYKETFARLLVKRSLQIATTHNTSAETPLIGVVSVFTVTSIFN